MTDLASRNCLLPQLHGVSAAQRLSLQKVPLGKDTPRSKRENFIVVSNSGSCRNFNTCICINDSESQGFVHKAFVSQACNEQSLVDHETDDLKYFSLLKEYVSFVLAIKSLINELEIFIELQNGGDEEPGSSKNQWDLSKVHNILERYRSDTRHIKRLELRFKSFLKSKMPYFSHAIGLNIQGLFKFMQCAEMEILQSIYTILNEGLLDLHKRSVDELMRKDSGWKTDCILLCHLAGKFEKIASDATNDCEKWISSWRSRVAIFVSRRSFKRSQSPLVYLKKLTQPYMLSYLKSWLISMEISEYVKAVTQIRAVHVSNHFSVLLYNLLFGEERLKIKGDANSHHTSTWQETAQNAEMNKNHTNLSSAAKRLRSQLFQELWDFGQKEEQLVSEFIIGVYNLNMKLHRGREVDLGVNIDAQMQLPDKGANKSALNGLVKSVGARSPGASKKVHWGDMTGSNIDKELINIYVNSLWHTTSEHLVSQLTHKCICVDKVCYEWDFSVTSMDLNQAAMFLSFLSVKKLRSDSGEISPAFNQCAIYISTNISFQISLQRWDQAMQNARVSAIKDKCRIAPNSHQRQSETMNFIVAAIAPLHTIFELLRSNRGSDMQKLNEESEYTKIRFIALALLSFSITMRIAIDWLHSKSQQFISSASWEQYHIITSGDAEVLQEKLRLIIPHFVSLTKKVHLMEKPNNFLLKRLEAVQDMFAEIKAICSRKIDALMASIRSRSRIAIKQHFPEAKIWRKRGSSRMPFEPNLYAKVTPHQVLLPVIESVKLIDQDEAEQLLYKCFSIYVVSLMDFILEESIKFSHYGANQLRLDFTCFKEWIGQDSLQIPTNLVPEILSQNSFLEFDAAITLLCCQPESRRRSNLGSDSENASSLGSTASQGSCNGSFYESTIREIELRNKEEWLALRMKGGQTKSKLLCITPS